MFLENELNGAFTLLRLLTVLLIGIAPIAVTIAIKQVLYARRRVEEETAAARLDSRMEKFPQRRISRALRRGRGSSSPSGRTSENRGILIPTEQQARRGDFL